MMKMFHHLPKYLIACLKKLCKIIYGYFRLVKGFLGKKQIFQRHYKCQNSFLHHLGPLTDRDNIYTAVIKALDSGQEIGLQSLYKLNHLI